MLSPGRQSNSRFCLQLLVSYLWLAVSVSAQTCERCFCSVSRSTVICPSFQLTSVPQDIFFHVTSMDLKSNQIGFLGKGSLTRYPNLVNLNLRSTNILFVHSKAFENTTQLQTLDLRNNNLTEINPDTFQTLTNLENLYLSSNDISDISEDTFAGLDKLKALYIDDNKLTSIPLSMVKPLKSLQTLEMSGNLFHCDCSIAWMKSYQPLRDSLTGPVVCSTPVRLKGTTLDQLEIDSLNCAPPTIEVVESIVQGFKGQQNIELRCIARGDPPPEIQWFHNREQLSDSIFYRLTENGSLMIVVMVSQLAGEYSCFAENLMGNDTGVVTLEYAGSQLPSFVIVPEDIHKFVGEEVTLSCSVDQFTDEVHWEKDGVRLDTSERVTVLHGTGLLIHSAMEEDSGVYACVASNEEGVRRAAAFVNITGPLLSCNGILSREDVERLRLTIDVAVNATHLQLQQATHSPSALLRRLKFPQGGLIEVLKAAEIFDQAVATIRSRLLMNQTLSTSSNIPQLNRCEVEILSELSGCETHDTVTDCSSCFHRKYRTIDGTCNNLDYPMRGSYATPFLRLLPPEYEDGIGLPVGWSTTKPSARHISQQIIAAREVSPSERFTLMLMQVGQFLDHDMDLAPMSPSGIVFNRAEPDSLTSCDDICHNDAPCFPIQVPKDDPRIKRECLPFTRSSAVCGTGAASLLIGDVGIHREQLNSITSYIDGSHIYGSNNSTAMNLRLHDGSGRLWAGQTVEGFPDKYFLPFDRKSLVDCETGIHEHRSSCFLAGDVRVNEQVGLTTMHTLFFREHNRVVKILRDLNPHWDGERLYQEARRIVIAEWQNIVYSEYLPKILGSEHMTSYSGYNSSADATISNAFATAAYRFGHSQIMPLFPRLDTNYAPSSLGPLRLQDAFFAPFRLLEEGGIDPLLRGLISSPVKMRVSHQGLNNNLTEALFNQAHQVSLDLAALNIQRGRDHGLPNYNQWREYCGLSAAETISDLRKEITNATVLSEVREVYGNNPNNIDLWVGGLIEDTLLGSQLGPTFQCIISDQFRRLRDGDRFWFEREGQFSPDQLVQMRQATLSRLICDNADNITRVPLDAFVLQSASDFVSCDSLPTVDLQLWKECPDCNGPLCEFSSRARRSTLYKSLETQSFYNELNLRVATLEDKLGFCIDEHGVYHDNHGTWTTGDCKTCTCQNGNLSCKKVECPPLSCETAINGEECCSVCKE